MAIVKSSLLIGGTTAFSIIQSYTLYDSQRNILGCCNEVTRPPNIIAPDPDDEEEEDEVSMFYPITNRYFVFPSTTTTNPLENNNDDEKLLRIRQTSFGCGRLGATVWPSSIALASLLAGPTYGSSIQSKRILELGSGCGLPSLTAKTICNCVDVLPTDYWERDGLVIGNRLVPKDLFGVNLQYNVGGSCEPYNLDWHDELSAFEVSTNFCPDLIIGSDLVYYPDDTEPLLQTLDIFLKNGLGSSGSGSERSILLILPLPPTAEREALPGFRKRLEGEDGEAVLGNGDRDVVMDELEMVVRSASNGEEEVHNLLRIRI